METVVYSIIPAGHKPLFWIAGIIGFVILVMLSVTVAMVVTWHGSQSARFEVSPAGLTLRGDFYGRDIPLAQLRGAEARVVDLRAGPALSPVSRRFGTGLPGYGAGWFRLANGEKALIYFTGGDRVVYVPTRNDYVVMLSVDHPDKMVNQIRTLAGTT